jgi:hypothetical protein
MSQVFIVSVWQGDTNYFALNVSSIHCVSVTGRHKPFPLRGMVCVSLSHWHNQYLTHLKRNGLCLPVTLTQLILDSFKCVSVTGRHKLFHFKWVKYSLSVSQGDTNHSSLNESSIHCVSMTRRHKLFRFKCVKYSLCQCHRETQTVTLTQWILDSFKEEWFVSPCDTDTMNTWLI